MAAEKTARPVDTKEFYPTDLFGYSNDLTDGELEVLKELRESLEKNVYPILTEYTEKAEFPFHAWEEITKVGFMNDKRLFEGREDELKTSELFNVFRYFELAKMDPSFATLYTVHGGLFYAALLYGGTKEQIDRWAPKVTSFENLTCFGLTEPLHGSDIAGGLATSARRDGDNWILNGEKRWIGGAKNADEIVIFARDVEDNKVKAFVVPGKAEGLTVENIKNKVSLRMVPNGHITMINVEVSEDRRLPNIHGFRDVAAILRTTRADISHLATGLAAGAFEAALRYVKEREQFGKKIGSFQLVQEKLSIMQANVTACLSYSVRLAQLQEEGNYSEVNSAMSKMHNALRMRETVALAREVVGGNGITLDTDVARFFTDAEAIYSYEGTHEINALIVGRYLTGESAFV
ncbi:Caffeyl-CoA reductase-Etf complex subunit CarC [Jeotgalibaca dankookensis]|uniref:Caffeyl-CoA reductase-Etf complex subunit CarC n=1 Tax=Jeotgalibaca dankookensis TaxID=708126 RepID=A0A1S6IQH7_9LACT|nr:acyl-CoA dehydrogenase family protein [Jeotgalibaca dankookensis]AQS53784.1 Caffeyl-CoA reductase-Etf complex subunit CarC [Jeotgalibaca dankookensis]